MTKGKIMRCFCSQGFTTLTPVFYTLQDKLNTFLEDDEIRHQLSQVATYEMIDGKRHNFLKGTIRDEIQEIIGTGTQFLKGQINNPAWYGRILIDNLIALIKSHNDQYIEWKTLKKYGKFTNKCKDELKEKYDLKISPSYAKTLLRAKSIPDLPKHKSFTLDYAASDKQIFIFDPDTLTCKVKISTPSPIDGKLTSAHWLSFSIYMPIFLRKEYVGKITKPMFYMDKQTGELVCQCAYEIKADKLKNMPNIFGCDLGRVKPICGIALHPDGTYSQEYDASNELQTLCDKFSRLQEHIDSVYVKEKRAESYNLYSFPFYKPYTNRQHRRKIDLQRCKTKRKHLKKQIARLAAVEIVNDALKEKCGTIHMEYLKWLLATGGKWDFAEIEKYVEELCQIFGLKFYRVNPAYTSRRHPLTGEIGKAVGRDIVFHNGRRIDRDFLAAINIALQHPFAGREKTHLKKKPRVHTKRTHGRLYEIKKQAKQLLNSKLRANKAVMFSHKQASSYAELALVTVNKKSSSETNNVAKHHFRKYYESYALQY